MTSSVLSTNSKQELYIRFIIYSYTTHDGLQEVRGGDQYRRDLAHPRRNHLRHRLRLLQDEGLQSQNR